MIQQTSYFGKKICGLLESNEEEYGFADLTLPDISNTVRPCPSGFQLCPSQATSLEHKFCYEKSLGENQCPINDI
jgi:hypothetical protein